MWGSMNAQTARQKMRQLVKLPKSAMDHVDGVLYQQWFSPHDVQTTYQKMTELNLRSDDIVFIGMPWSGNGWAYQVASRILNQSTAQPEKSFADVYAEFFSDESRAEFANQPSPRMLWTNARITNLPQIAKEKPKVVYIMRNPKDEMWFYFNALSQNTDEYHFNGSWQEFYDIYMVGEMVHGTWMDHVLSFEKFMEENPDVPVHIHQFEEMRINPVAAIKKLCAFLDVSDELAWDIAEATSVEKDDSDQGDLQYKVNGKGEAKFVDRKRSICTWKGTFTIEQNVWFNEVFDSKMAGSRLTDLIRRYI